MYKKLNCIFFILTFIIISIGIHAGVFASSSSNTKNNYIVNGQYYSTLQEAYQAITGNSGTIKVNQSCVDSSDLKIEEGKNIVLDTNGAIITKTKSTIKNYGTLTINGSGGIKTLTNGKNILDFLLMNYGTMTINNGVIENAGVPDKSWYTVYGVRGTLNINGGTIKSYFAGSGINNNLTTSAVNTKSTLNISGGEIESSMYGIMSYDADVNIKITDGIITGNKHALRISGKNSSGTVQIVGGTLKGVSGNAISHRDNSVLKIGKDNSKLSQSSPIIQGKIYAIDSEKFEFYDGVLKGAEQVYKGNLSTKEGYIQEKGTEKIDGVTYNTLVLRENTEETISTVVDTQIKALIETAHAYYRQGEQLQYDSYKKNIISSPEDATSQNYIYTVCSGFTFQTYYHTLGISIPETTETLLDYAKANKTNESVVLFYFDTAEEVYSDKGLGTKSKPNYSTFAKKMAEIARPGDVFVITGHAMLIESIDKEKGTVTLIESETKTGRR